MMKFQLKNNTPLKIQHYIKEMKSICGNQQAFYKLFIRNQVNILLKRYPNKIRYQKQQETDQMYLQYEEEIKCYYQLLSYIQVIESKKFQLPSKYRSQYHQVLRSICHINFENLEQLNFRYDQIMGLECLAFLNAPKLEKIIIENHKSVFWIKSMAKTKFNQLKRLQISSNQDFSIDQIKYLNRVKFLRKQRKEIKELITIKLSEFIKKNPVRLHMVSLCAKIPSKTLTNHMFEDNVANFEYSNGIININVQISQLIR